MEMYTVNGSPNCRKVEAVMRHLGLECKINTLDFLNGDLKQAEFLAINPNGKVPALVDGDLKLWESNAIMQYLADSKPGNSLFPQDAKQRADIVRWQSWELAHWNSALGTIIWETWVKPNYGMGEPNSAVVESAVADFHRYAAVLDKHLADRKFVCGDNVTLADYSIGCAMTMAQQTQAPLDDYPNIQAWYARLNQDPAWAASLHQPPESKQAAS